ncbi:hypothetical protein BDN70DRAFT_184768 [Pholiota conissans]|uniref:Uncharacterized protein n=1 Tax=Pholiota conissans TaxID=109636 RepID=A0A9P5YXC0_9AGAR|nr:hypothetical protein BDN70DRAFT_184768 [Pholiota conissans]
MHQGRTDSMAFSDPHLIVHLMRKYTPTTSSRRSQQKYTPTPTSSSNSKTNSKDLALYFLPTTPLCPHFTSHHRAILEISRSQIASQFVPSEPIDACSPPPKLHTSSHPIPFHPNTF